ncbi:hypothetical protein ACVXHB_00215 [Escherichia coli]
MGKASVMMLTSKETILQLFGALILVGCSYSRRYFTRFLERSAAKVGKVTQDHFWLNVASLFLVDSRRVTVTGAVDNAGLRLARGVALSAGGRDWRWCNGHRAAAVGSDDLRHLPARTAFMLIASIWLAARTSSRGMRYYLMSIGYCR